MKSGRQKGSRNQRSSSSSARHSRRHNASTRRRSSTAYETLHSISPSQSSYRTASSSSRVPSHISAVTRRSLVLSDLKRSSASSSVQSKRIMPTVHQLAHQLRFASIIPLSHDVYEHQQAMLRGEGNIHHRMKMSLIDDHNNDNEAMVTTWDNLNTMMHEDDVYGSSMKDHQHDRRGDVLSHNKTRQYQPTITRQQHPLDDMAGDPSTHYHQHQHQQGDTIPAQVISQDMAPVVSSSRSYPRGLHTPTLANTFISPRKLQQQQIQQQQTQITSSLQSLLGNTNQAHGKTSYSSQQQQDQQCTSRHNPLFTKSLNTMTNSGTNTTTTTTTTKRGSPSVSPHRHNLPFNDSISSLSPSLSSFTPFRPITTSALFNHCVNAFDHYHNTKPSYPLPAEVQHSLTNYRSTTHTLSSRSIVTTPGLPTRAVYTLNLSSPSQSSPSSSTSSSQKQHPLYTPTRGLKGTWKPAPGGAYEVGKEPKPGEEGLTGKLDEYCTDLTKEAMEGKLDPMIGRHDILQRTVEVLSRRRKNNPILTGEPGTGKTAIVEGLAQLIVQNEVPQSLQNAKIYTLDLARLVSGTSFRGEFEERLLGIINDLQKRPEVILFVDEVHQLVGAGKTDGAMDAANILKPALARGKIRFMGATTTKEYTQHIEKDGALNRRFEPIHVPEPSVEDTITILRGLKSSYEEHHQVRFMDNAMVAAATMAKRYFSDRKLPDKAIDLLDEAASHVCILLESKPPHLLHLEQDLLYSRMELQGLENDTEESSTRRKEHLKARIERLAHVYKAKMDRWETRKRLRKAVMDLERDVNERIHRGMTMAQNIPPPSPEFMMKAATELSFVQAELASARAAYEEYNKTHNFKDDDTVTHDTIANVVARHTGVPVTKLLSQDKEKLLNLEDELRKRVVAQDHALEAVATCVRVARAGLHDGRRPQGVFLFCGPSGVGKTELCKALADNLYGSSDAMIRLDMSEYSEQHSVARLIGAAPGYIGYEEGGQLTEAVRKRPYQVVLLDEIEKAHKQVITVLLQVMEEASLTDGKGNQVDFSNTILIMTSNLGAHEAVEWSSTNTTESEESKSLISKEIMNHAVKRHFAPEFINRINDIVMFNSLRRENMDSIVRIQLGHVQQLLDDNNNSLLVSPAAQHEMAERGFDPVYGARPIKRTIYREVTQVIAQAILSGDIDKNCLIVMKRHDEDDLLLDLDQYQLVDTEGKVLDNKKVHADPIYTFKVYRKQVVEKKDTRETYDLSNDEDDIAYQEAKRKGLKGPKQSPADLNAKRILSGESSSANKAKSATSGDGSSISIDDDDHDSQENRDLLQKQLDANANTEKIMQDVFMAPKRPSRYSSTSILDDLSDVLDKPVTGSNNNNNDDEEISGDDVATPQKPVQEKKKKRSSIFSMKRNKDDNKDESTDENDKKNDSTEKSSSSSSSPPPPKQANNTAADAAKLLAQVDMNEFYVEMVRQGIDPTSLSYEELKKHVNDFLSKGRGKGRRM